MEEKKHELVSVIVPIYKVEDDLLDCVTSIQNQTHTNLEIILVDDGSPDKCGEMCDVLAKDDNRIIVIHQENGGLSSARNAGMQVMKGDYITFVDSDDYIAPIMFEFLLGQFQDGVDIVECDYCITENDHAKFDKKEDTYEYKIFSAEDAMCENINDRIFRQLIWNKMYRRKVIGNVRFPVGNKIDDEFWTYQVLGNAKKLVYAGKILYAYRQQDSSVMHRLSAENRFESIQAKIQRHEYICRKMPVIKDLWFTCMYQGQLALRTMNKMEFKKIYDKLESVIHRYPISKKKLKISNKQRFWLRMASISFYWTCRIRNFLRIGL